MGAFMGWSSGFRVLASCPTIFRRKGWHGAAIVEDIFDDDHANFWGKRRKRNRAENADQKCMMLSKSEDLRAGRYRGSKEDSLES
jgi:hypothetical protein